MNYYPVVIPTLCRYEHLRNCVESLSRCKFADHTELIIGLDYPAKESHRPGYEKIKAWLPQITGFHKVTVIERPENYGAVRNIRTLREYAFERYDAIITSEDDNVFAPVFLQFMDSALTNFASDPRIGSVCGYTHPEQYNENADYLLSYDSSAWGFGIWADKYKKRYDAYDINAIKKLLGSRKLCWTIFRKFPACLAMLVEMCNKNDFYGDSRNSAVNVIEKIFQVKPGISLVRNMGHDGSGMHGGQQNSQLMFQPISQANSYALSKDSNGYMIPKTDLFFYTLSQNKFKAILQVIRIFVKTIILRKRND